MSVIEDAWKDMSVEGREELKESIELIREQMVNIPEISYGHLSVTTSSIVGKAFYGRRMDVLLLAQYAIGILEAKHGR